MNPQNNQPQDQPKPFAYDAEGRPLYAAPPANNQPDNPNDYGDTKSHITNTPNHHEGYNFDPRMRAQYGNEPGVVHATRDIEPKNRKLSPEQARRCEDSRGQYPDLNLSDGECVIMSIKRHPIGLLAPLAATIGVIILLLVSLVMYPIVEQSGNQVGVMPSFGVFAVIAFILMILIGLTGYLAIWVYIRNTFYLTNESVIQEIQHSIFSKHEQTVSLGSIEDASYRQSGILQTVFNYGTIRLSTEGEETTYRFHFVSSPKTQIATLNNAIEDFKNGRPVGD